MSDKNVARRPAADAANDEENNDNLRASEPEFRFVQMQQQRAAEEPEMTQVIHKQDYLSSHKAQNTKENERALKSMWSPSELRTVPAFYPLEKSSRLVEDDTSHNIAARLCDCLRQLSIQAIYNNDTACLVSSENVEMHLSLWMTPPNSPQQGIVVELQRRSGDSIAFHRYSRTILDAAMGLLDEVPLELDIGYSKKVQRLLASAELKNSNGSNGEHETAIQAIEIAHGLLMKDRMDARVLGLESLCLLTDPRKTGYMTSILTAHVVLLGSTTGVEIPGVTEGAFKDEGPFQEIRESILNLVQFSRIGEDEDLTEDDLDADKEHITLLHNLALAVLANSLDCIENNADNAIPEETTSRSRLRTASSNDVANEFLQQTEDISKKEILSTLISELGKASLKPHNAVLSAKCIGSLCRASDDAKKRARDLGAKQVVSTALDVGVRTHLKLETECQNVATVLNNNTPRATVTEQEMEEGKEEEEDEAKEEAAN